MTELETKQSTAPRRLVVMAVGAVALLLLPLGACDRDESRANRTPAAATQSAMPIAPPTTSPDAVREPDGARPEDEQPATKPWVMPSPEELAVKAAVIRSALAESKARAQEMEYYGRKAPDVAHMTVFLDIRKEEEEALMPMLAEDVPLLKRSAKMRTDKDSGEAFDTETGRPALAINVEAVKIREAPIPRMGPEATAAVATSPTWHYWYYELSKASGQWVVIKRYMGAVS
jgi:hypothetical protein